MFRNTYQAGFLSVFYAIGGKPLSIWSTKTANGHIKRVTDPCIRSMALEIIGNNVSTTYISCPTCPHKSLGIRLPFLIIIAKNLKSYFTFEVEILDDQNFRRRFRASNFQSCTRVRPFGCSMPLRLDEGWNQIHINLSDFTRRAYGTNYVEATRIQIHANCRLRRVYFCDRLYAQPVLSDDFKVFVLNATRMTPKEVECI